MISVSCLEVLGSFSYVCLSGFIIHCCDFSFINYALCQAFPISWAVLALSAVAEFFVVFINARQTYIGVTANDFKTRYRNHLKSLCNEKYKHEMESSKHIWNLKKENRQFSIRWAIVKQIPAGRNGKRNCTLYLEEKLMIMKGRSKNILNRCSEMFSKCRHVI